MSDETDDTNEQIENSETGSQAAADKEPTVMDAMMGKAPDNGTGYNIDAMLNVGLQIQIILGKTRMPISSLLKLSRGSIIELDKKIGEPVDIVINDRVVARGDLVKLDGDKVGVSLIEIVKDYVSEA
ncbi:FliM/FliN family flagellar motor switch protein [Pseudooceanicola sp. C21-150M6]|uniref:FliM/FliN family flagellar motor switch protein n=1 Tax=Pseudooceanicola sp. C21-150M6 TaxID=3434355 RepID=UPI003D7F6DF1